MSLRLVKLTAHQASIRKVYDYLFLASVICELSSLEELDPVVFVFYVGQLRGELME